MSNIILHRPNLIIRPSGDRKLQYHDLFNKNEHWAIKNEKSTYELWLNQYTDSIPPENMYDKLFIKPGTMRWLAIKEILNETEEWKRYEYIGFFDDDLASDIDNINAAIQVAKDNNLKIFQPSLTQDSRSAHFATLGNQPGVLYTTTQMNEIMCIFIHSSLIPELKELLNSYGVWAGWGIDFTIGPWTNVHPAVIHTSKIFHPPDNGSTYSFERAMTEANNLLQNVFPALYKQKYNSCWAFNYIESTKEISKKWIGQ